MPPRPRVNIELLVWVGLALVARLLVVARPFPFIDGTTTPDDTYLSMSVARNLARGLGPLYGSGFTNGFQPLFVYLMVPFFKLIPNDPVLPVRLSMVLLSLVDCGTLVLLLNWMRRDGISERGRWLAGAAWALSPTLIATATNGLETSLALFFETAALYWFTAALKDQRVFTVGGAARFGALLGLAIFARIDALILAALLGIELIITGRRQPQQTARAVAVTALTAIAINLPSALYLHAYTGAWFPISGRAVRWYGLWYRGADQSWPAYFFNIARSGAKFLVGDHAPLMVAITVAIIALAVVHRGKLGAELEAAVRPHRRLFAYAGAMFVSYVFLVPAVWFFSRYMIACALAPTMLLATLGERLSTKALAPVAAALAIATLLMPLTSWLYVEQLANGYMNIGLWAKQRFPAGTRLGSMQTGGLAYFADDLQVVNLDGVVSAEAYDALTHHTMGAYLKQEKVRYVVGWPINFKFLGDHSPDLPATAWHKLEDTGVTSWGRKWELYEVDFTELPPTSPRSTNSPAP
jgi:hypothetical protein